LAKTGDCDNGFAMIEYENGTKVSFHLSRTSQNGHDAACEIFGSAAKMTVNWVRFFLISTPER
jgi:myo-inositol 2-dehydrogenase/D-chiro-inositol 1-dehydrogenase